MEIEISKEGKRNFKGDDILLMENIEEKVHKTRNLVDVERSLVFRTIQKLRCSVLNSYTKQQAKTYNLSFYVYLSLLILNSEGV